MEVFARVHPLEYNSKFLEQSVRADGRALLATRRVSLGTHAVDSALGSALVRVGNTAVIAGVTGALGPAPDDESAPSVVASVELLPLASPRFAYGRPSDDARAVGAWLNELLSGGRVRSPAASREPLVDAASLRLPHLQPPRVVIDGDADTDGDGDGQGTLIERDEREPLLAWFLSVDMYVLDYSGNLYDAALLALVAALGDVRLPRVRRRGALDYVRAPRATEPLRLLFTPLPNSFALIGDTVVADPTDLEEDVAAASLTVVLDEHGRIRSMHKPGGAAISIDATRQCLSAARERLPTMQKLLRDAATR
eukprot:TRINITY_DN4858_c0_g1_i1.p1 TRINITY_DN4858_c0_g1~~TRINITY_DN4858_c0_g1_i1.p1  ORF type:complete len:310 (-),score=187.97 TRINITY_DN4858_c0_g1_i1:117-1046(-)